MFDAVVLPDAESIRRTAQSVVERPIYRLDANPDPDASFLSLMFRVIRIVLTPFRLLIEFLKGLPDGLQFVIGIVLTLALVALVTHIIYSLVRSSRTSSPSDAELLDDLRLVRDPAVLERQSEEALRRQDYIGAIRLLFRAGILRLEQAENKEYRAGTTSREFLRRHRDTAVFESIRLIVSTIENKWYGQGMCGADDFSACRDAYADIVRRTTDGTHAHRA